MEKEKTFVVKPPEKPKSPKQYERSEMHDDLILFPEDVQPLVKKDLKGQLLTSAEYAVLHYARNVWWQDKYGFPYDNEIAREEVLRRKYASSEEMTEQEDMQKQLFQAFRGNNAEETARLRNEYEKYIPTNWKELRYYSDSLPFLKLTNIYKDIRKGR